MLEPGPEKPEIDLTIGEEFIAWAEKYWGLEKNIRNQQKKVKNLVRTHM